MLTKIYKLWIVTLITIFCFSSCKDNTIPESVYTVDEMTDFLFDYHIAYTHGDKTVTDFRNRQVFIHELIDGLLVKKGWNRESFYQSYEYYVAHPVLLDTIYTRVFNQMQAVQSDPSIYQ